MSAKANKLKYGSLEGGIYKREAYKSKHLFKRLDSWAILKSEVEQLLVLGCETIEIYELEENSIYSIPLFAFVKHAKRINYGYGEQLAVGREFFEKKSLQPVINGL